MITPSLTCASCGYSLQDLAQTGVCPECSLSIQESAFRHAHGSRPAFNPEKARLALCCIGLANAIGSLLCFVAVVGMLLHETNLLTVIAIAAALNVLVERRAWVVLATALSASARFRAFMLFRFVLPAIVVGGGLLSFMALLIAPAFEPLGILAFGGGAIVALFGGLAAAIGSIAELKFLNEASRRWTSDPVIPLFGWIAIVLAAAAWLSMVGGTGTFILPILCLSYAASAAWALRARSSLPRGR